MPFSFERATKILNQEFRTGTVYLALYTSDPTGNDTGQEVSGGGYARQIITFSAPSVEGGRPTIKNIGDITFPAATADWGTLTHVAIRSAATGGELIASGALKNSRTIHAGDRFVIDLNNGVVGLK